MGAFFKLLGEIIWAQIERWLEFVRSPIAGMLNSLEEAFPQFSPAIETFRTWLECVQPFIDINTLSAFFSVWAAFHLVMATYRFGKSFAPTVSSV